MEFSLMDRHKTLSVLSFLEKFPEAEAFKVGTRAYSRRELAEASAKAAAFLTECGVEKGDAVAIWLPDGPTWLQFFFAAARIGALVVPISTRYKEAEAEHVLHVSRARILIVARRFLSFDYAQAAASILNRAECELKAIIDVDIESFFNPPMEIAAPLAPNAAEFDVGNELPLCTFGTSGTTGRPKLAIHTQSSIAQHVLAVARATDIGNSSVQLCCLPLYGILGFVVAMATLAGGGRCIFLPVFDAEQAASLVDREGVTHIYGSDALLKAILDVSSASLSTWKRGGFAEFAGVGRRTVELAEQRNGLRLNALYGSSECYAVMAARPRSAPAAERALAGGTPITSDIEFRVVDPESGAPCPLNTPGELQIRGRVVTTGYLNNPGASKEAMTEDGWFRTGDLAYSRGEDFVFLSRMRDTMRLSGYLVDPTEIEEVLCHHESVAAAQVVSAFRKEKGEVAYAFVRPHKSPLAEDELRAFCRSRLAGYKVPARVLVVDVFPEIDGPNGVKIQKSKLREMAAEVEASTL